MTLCYEAPGDRHNILVASLEADLAVANGNIRDTFTQHLKILKTVQMKISKTPFNLFNKLNPFLHKNRKERQSTINGIPSFTFWNLDRDFTFGYNSDYAIIIL